MMGRSWWKQFGYNSPCSCAYEAHEAYVKKEEEEEPEEEEEEEPEEEDEEWSLTENQRCWGNLIDEEFPNTTAEQKKCLLSIAREVDFIDIKPYSHNIVGMELGFLDKAGFDKQKIKEVVKLFGLENKGWKYLLG
jgi:hypothetical protein